MSAEHITPGQAAVRLIAILEAESAVFTLDADEVVSCDLSGVRDFKGHDPDVIQRAVCGLWAKICDVLRRSHGTH